jgi:excisionase family DNA binding protein
MTVVPGGCIPTSSRKGFAMAKQPDVVMTLREVAGYLKIAMSTAYKLAQESKIPGQKVGRHWRFHRDGIDRWLKNHPWKAES